MKNSKTKSGSNAGTKTTSKADTRNGNSNAGKSNPSSGRKQSSGRK